MEKLEELLKQLGVRYALDFSTNKFFLQDQVIYLFGPEDGTWGRSPLDVIELDIEAARTRWGIEIGYDQDATKILTYADGSQKIVVFGKNISLMKALDGEHPPRPKLIGYDYVVAIVQESPKKGINAKILTESSIIP